MCNFLCHAYNNIKNTTVIKTFYLLPLCIDVIFSLENARNVYSCGSICEEQNQAEK